jgi:hypothetical protein
MRLRQAQLGCLTILLLFALLGTFVEYFGNSGTPGDDEGGGPIAALGIVGLILFFVIFGALELLAILFKKPQEPQGFPIVPTSISDKRDDKR